MTRSPDRDGSVPSETAPLLGSGENVTTEIAWFAPLRRVMASQFCISLAFAFTQTPIIYIFRVLTCDEYYKTHGAEDGDGRRDRCAIPQIEADTATNVAILTSTTMFFTVINVFVVGWIIKRYGVKAAMFQQTAWAAARNLSQIYAQTIGGETGIRIIEVTQIFNVLGGAGGAQLASNAYIASLASAEERTALFGMMSGVSMLGAALGFVGGGIAYRHIGPLVPFTTAFLLLCFATLFGLAFLPYIPPTTSDEPEKKKGMFRPLRVFLPRRRMINGKNKWDLNLSLLGLGAFFSVFATGYVSMGLQLIGTNVFGFEPMKSGFMLSFTLLVKSFFLSICFPRIIASGRYHLFIAAGVLPFASGTGPAAKGVTLDFCEPSIRADALGAITLIEMLAYIATTGLFGYVFAFLSSVQKPMLLFVANGAVAFIAFFILLPIRMPKPGQELAS